MGRYGVVTRGSVMAEQTPGGFAGVYRVLRELEQTGSVLRGYYIETLGAARSRRPQPSIGCAATSATTTGPPMPQP